VQTAPAPRSTVRNVHRCESFGLLFLTEKERAGTVQALGLSIRGAAVDFSAIAARILLRYDGCSWLWRCCWLLRNGGHSESHCREGGQEDEDLVGKHIGKGSGAREEASV